MVTISCSLPHIHGVEQMELSGAYSGLPNLWAQAGALFKTDDMKEIYATKDR